MKSITFFTAGLTLAFFISGCNWNRLPDYDDFSTRFKGERTELYYQDEMWDFARFLQIELDKNPDMQCEDLYKYCRQAAFGIDSNISGERLEAFNSAFAAVEPDSSRELLKVTSPDTARVDLAAWKAAGMPPEWLFRMSAAEGRFSDGKEKLREYLDIAEKLADKNSLTFSGSEFRKFAGQQENVPEKKHLPHSTAYRKNNPPYRTISTRYFHAIEVLKAAAELNRHDPDKIRIIAIDGRSASGKTTLARQLKFILNAQTIHMDDFFLPPEMRNKTRYEQAGGNVHYERFCEEVLPGLKKTTAFSYRIFDCKKNRFHGNRMIWESRWRIVEGAYSLHPEFGKYADLKIFYDISPDEQMRRIYERNGAKNARIFQTRWIPLEEKYIENFNIRKKADLILK